MIERTPMLLTRLIAVAGCVVVA
ncbi:MAG: hypothetical protein QOD36_4714, partial [Mycobacterium sp.]|nr:hypothetical protein [Mycobacterium sp.]